LDWLESPDRVEPLRRTGAALAELHALSVRATCTSGIDRHLRDLLRPSPEALAERVPDVAARVQALTAWLDARPIATNEGRRQREVRPDVR
jgi:hypothetical protein